MSILLDALRKSERRDRLGGVPDIHSAEPATGAGDGSAWWRPAVAVLLIAVVLGGGYAAWRWWVASSVPVAPPELPAQAATAPTPAAAQEVEAPASAVSGRPGSAGKPGTATSPRLDRQPRSPVERLSGDKPYQAAGAQDSSGAPASDTSAAGSRAADSTGSDTAAGRNAGTEAGSRAPEPGERFADSVASAEAAVLGSERPADRQTGAGARQPAPDTSSSDAALAREAPREPVPASDDSGLISYWQLPRERRNDLPEFRINVMVWDELPERRFIIMGGKRYLEGDEVGPRLSLEEVRRDRVVFRQGPYRFYVTQ